MLHYMIDHNDAINCMIIGLSWYVYTIIPTIHCMFVDITIQYFCRPCNWGGLESCRKKEHLSNRPNSHDSPYLWMKTVSSDGHPPGAIHAATGSAPQDVLRLSEPSHVLSQLPVAESWVESD